jgi:hypothetical protein
MEGGILWFTDLTVPDTTYALPIIASGIFLLTVELGAADGMQGQDPTMMGRMKWFLRVLAVLMVPLTASMPAVRLSPYTVLPLLLCLGETRHECHRAACITFFLPSPLSSSCLFMYELPVVLGTQP